MSNVTSQSFQFSEPILSRLQNLSEELTDLHNLCDNLSEHMQQDFARMVLEHMATCADDTDSTIAHYTNAHCNFSKHLPAFPAALDEQIGCFGYALPVLEAIAETSSPELQRAMQWLGYRLSNITATAGRLCNEMLEELRDTFTANPPAVIAL